jgi:SAM-dependent methyltransferase
VRQDIGEDAERPTSGPASEMSTLGGSTSDEVELPNEDLRWRVTGYPDAKRFLDTGSRSLRDLSRALSLLGKSISDYPRALDFGCGPGRILLQLKELAKSVELHGCDIDPEAIDWAQKNIPWARSVVSPYLPPTQYADGFFDLIFNHSVFSHLDEHYQDSWLAELKRITKPRAILLLSVSGQRAFADLEESWRKAGVDPKPLRRRLESDGILYIAEDNWRGGPFPDFYHSAFHAPWYVLEHWGEFFEIRAYITRGALDLQDLVVLQRRDE